MLKRFSAAIGMLAISAIFSACGDSVSTVEPKQPTLTGASATLAQVADLQAIGAVYTRATSCTMQNANHYEVGEQVFVIAINATPGTSHAWSITGVSGTHAGEVVASGTGVVAPNGEMCVAAWTVPEQFGGVYKASVMGANDHAKTDNFNIALDLETALSATSTGGTYGGSATITLALMAGATAVTNQPVSVTIEGVTYACTTDAAGNCSVSVPGLSAGAHAFTATFAGSPGYLTSTTSGSVLVDRAPITATVASSSTQYDGQTVAATCAIGGSVFNSDEITCAAAPAIAGPNVGSTTVSPVVSGNDAGNYAVTLVDGTLTITPAPLTVRAIGLSKVYDGYEVVTGCSVDGTLFGSDGENFSCAPAPSLVSKNAGVTAVTAEFGGTAASNYAVTVVGATVEITPLRLTMTIVGLTNKVYDGLGETPGCDLATVLGRDDVTCLPSPASVSKNVGTTNVTGVLSGADLGNYTVAGQSASVTISPASVTATAGSATATWNGSMATAAACAVSANFDNLSCTNTPTSAGPAVGSYTTMPSVNGDVSNYIVTPVSGSINIVSYGASCYKQPIEPMPLGGKESHVKAGSVVPVKCVRIENASVPVIGTVGTLTVTEVGSTKAPLVIRNAYRYDVSGALYIYNLDTSNGLFVKGKMYALTTTWADGVTPSHTGYITIAAK
jgi:hypothetical protein